jgi:predicted ABC-type ATPase
VIAGPNGIGKTTSSYDLVSRNIPLINSDEIAKEARITGMLSVNTQEYSNQEAARLVDEQLTQRNSFAIETNLADVDTWKFILKVQEIGYELHIKYISTDKLELLNSRIEQRVLLGEHFVRPDIVEQRYVSSLKLLGHYFNKPDILELFDNSKTMSLMAEVRKGQVIVVANPLPEWISSYLGKHLNPSNNPDSDIRDLSDLDAVRKKYESLKKK